jgi:tRNA-specific 2-thiouridylase
LAQAQLVAQQVNWLVEPPVNPFNGFAQIRYNSDAVPARITPAADNTFSVAFNDPTHGIAPGQLCVIYADDRVLGGGWIR